MVERPEPAALLALLLSGLCETVDELVIALLNPTKLSEKNLLTGAARSQLRAVQSRGAIAALVIEGVIEAPKGFMEEIGGDLAGTLEAGNRAMHDEKAILEGKIQIETIQRRRVSA